MPNLQFAKSEPSEIQFDHSVTVNPFTGSANLNIPFQFTPGRGEFGPALSLQYDSSAVNSPFGMGWSLSGLLSISIDTRKHLPRYDGTDDFVFNAVGDLVPALDATSQWQPIAVDTGAYWVSTYRARIERGFLRVEKWLEKTTSRIHWRTRDARNVLTIFGLRDDGLSRIADPADPLRTFVWLPDATYDSKGNAIVFEYIAENLDNVDRTQSFEHSRHDITAQRYLKNVLYGNSAPMAADAPIPAGNRWAYEVVFDYGDHSAARLPAAVPDQPWSVRPDPFSTFRPGFEVRTYRLCRRILQFHNFPAFAPGPFLTGSFDLDHEPNPAGTTLKTVSYTGCRVDSSTAKTSQRSLPPLAMTYTAPSVGTTFSPAPAEALQNVPFAFAEQRFRWVDLFGEGLPGLLTENAGGWFYNRNQGAGNFSPQQNISRQPACSLANFVLNDFDADGNTDVAVMHGRGAGFYEFNRDSGEWRNFRLIPEMPHLEGAPSAQWLDLNGDGRQDLVLTSPTQVLWFPSQGKDGFSDPVEVPRQQTPDEVAPLNQDLSLDYFFADMSGDGLLDQVRVRNGRVEYWPQLGNAKFGDPILMEDSPIFAPTGEFDPSRVLLVDLDGKGGADIVYLGDGEVRYWLNAAGNRLLDGGVVGNLPYIDNVSSARVIDFFGDGTACLVWCSPLADGSSSIQYLPLTNGVKPHLLLSVNNSMGMEVNLTYSTSATDYLRDQRLGRSWRTKLPNHPVVVTRKEVADAIGGNRTATRYEYHDGYYDGTERTFAGFGAVDQYDSDAPDPASAAPDIVLTSPACLRTWFHQGYPWQGIPQCAYQGDAKEAALATMVFDDPDPLDAREFCEGWRALTGKVIRQELFALTKDGKLATDPFQVTQSSYRTLRLQPAQGEHEASFYAFAAEQLTYTYEQTNSDPRVSHDFIFETDSFGNPTLECSAAYPRRSAVNAVDNSQRRTLISATRQSFLNIDSNSRYELTIPYETQEFEIAGITPPRDAILDWVGLRQKLELALETPLAFDQDFTSGIQAKLIQWHRTYYWRDSADIALPLGQAGNPVLLHHVETACFTPAWASTTWGTRVDKSLLQNDAGLTLKDGYWWQSGETWVWNAAADFFQLAKIQRAEGQATSLSYDTDFLQITQIQDALGNTTRAEIDYNLPAPFRIIDLNNNTAEVLYDPLGIPVVSTTYGQLLDARGNPQSYGNDPLAAFSMPLNPTFDAVLANPSTFVQNASEFTCYELDSWTTNAIPPRSVKLVREQNAHDGTGTAATISSRIQVAVVHSDGFRNVLQTKLLVEPGPALQRDANGHLVLDAAGKPVEGPPGTRWLANGHTIFNRKQLPVRQYEPFYSVTPQYESEDALQHFGVFREFQYDASSRQVREDFPNGTFSRTAYSAWEITSYDQNDTVLDSTYKSLRDGLPATDLEKMALTKAEAHANTPTRVQLNPQGLEIRRINTASPGDDRITAASLDIKGRTISLTDARGLTAMAYSLDMAGRPLYIHSIDAGDRVIVLDAFDRPVHQWDAAGLHESRRFDALDRPISLSVDGAPGLNQMVEQYIYGEDASVQQAQLTNLRGQLALLRDQAGIISSDLCDPEGRVLRSTRRLRSDYKSEPDWSNPAAVALDADSYVSAITVDALGRITSESPPDGTTRQLRYLQGGGLQQVAISSSDGKLANTIILSGADYNARGERTRVQLGNGVQIDRTYDSETFLVTRIAAARAAGNSADALQDLRYTYDPVGNIVYSVDRAQAPGVAGPFIQGLNVSPESEFTYDALYQLTIATGRVHQALLQNDYVPGAPGSTKGTRHLNFNNGAAVERYKRSYCYDLAGNLKSISHQGTTQNWKTQFWISPSSNRSLPALDTAANPITNPESRFDANGNCIYFPYLRSVGWNSGRNLARAVTIDRTGTGNPDDAEYYVYDTAGNRVRKVTEKLVAGQLQVTDVVYLDRCEIKRITGGGQPLLARATSHISDDTGRIALIYRWSLDASGLETSDISKARTRYQLTNHLGSSLIELDELAAVITYEEYFPFGGTAFLAGNDDREISIRVYRFCGKERDDTTGLYYFGYRYYASWMGRWISPDPIGPKDDLNLYRYVRNNPVCLYDPDGLQGTPPPPTKRGHSSSKSLEATPPEVLQAWGNLSNEEREQHIREGTNLWAYNVETGKVDFVSQNEIRRRKEETLKKGKNTLDVYVAPKKKPKTEPKTPPPGPKTDADAGGTDTGSEPPKDSNDGNGEGAKGAGGEQADGKGKGKSEDSDGTGVHAGDGSSNENTPPTGGLGDGTGPGAGNKGTGKGGGGKGDGTPGAQGTGPGTGQGSGSTGDGTGPQGATGSDAQADASQAHGDPNGVPGGTGNQPGGKPGGTGTGDESIPKSEHPPNSNLPPSNGTIPAPPGQTVNGTDPNGTPNGSLNGNPNGRGHNTGTGRSGSGLGSGAAGNGSNPGGKPGGQGDETGGQKPPHERTFGDRAVKYFGYANFEFSGSKTGESGGVPGGHGTHNWGGFGQALYAVVTAINTVLMFFGGAELKAGLMSLKAGLKAALAGVAKLFTRELWQGVGAKLVGWWAEHSMQIAMGKGGIPFLGHMAWNAAERGWMHAAGTKPLLFLSRPLETLGELAAGKLTWAEVLSLQKVSVRGAATWVTKNAPKIFRVPALRPGLANAAEGRTVLSCWTSTWNAWSRANYHIPNIGIAAGAAAAWHHFFGSEQAPQPKPSSGNGNP
jgi:RHS repeat-associated protein